MWQKKGLLAGCPGEKPVWGFGGVVCVGVCGRLHSLLFPDNRQTVNRTAIRTLVVMKEREKADGKQHAAMVVRVGGQVRQSDRKGGLALLCAAQLRNQDRGRV